MPELLLHAANVAFLLSYLVRDILGLRVLCTVAATLLLSSFTVMEPIAWSGIGWQSVFIAINVVQITLLILERRPLKLSEDEERLHRLAFHGLALADFKALVAVVRFETRPVGDALLRHGDMPSRLYVVLDGQTEVRVRGDVLALLGPGQMVGEMSFVSGKPASADVVVSRECRLAGFERVSLAALISNRPALGLAVQAIFGKDLVEKLRVAGGAGRNKEGS